MKASRDRCADLEDLDALDQSLQAIGPPGRRLLDDQEIVEQPIVGDRCLSIDSGRVVQRLALDHSSGVEAERLQIATKLLRITTRVDELSVACHDLFDVAVEPLLRKRVRRSQSRFGEPPRSARST